jgi:hypothetical protein
MVQRSSDLLRIGYGTCPSLTKIQLQENRPTLVRSSSVLKELLRAYGEVFVGSLRYDLANIMIRDHLKEAQLHGKIQISLMKKEVVKAILKSKPIGALAFLKSKGLLSKDSLNESIRFIKSLTVKSLQERLGVN